MTVFLDTVGLIALWDTSDQWHPLAAASFAKLHANRAELISTNAVLLECGNAAARRPYRSAVLRLRNQLEESQRLVFPDMDDWKTAWSAYERGVDAASGIVDQISFAVMRRLQISEAFTNDRHFRAAGLKVLF